MNGKKEIIKIGWNLDNSYTHLPEIFFTMQEPEIVPSPKLVVLNHPIAKYLGLNPKELEGDDGISMLAGNEIPKGSMPIAEAYAGHQFGHFTMLGDGRALLLGEQITPKNERFDIQLKGSGRTSYSRGGDGKAALGPMLREYIISEAMNALGIPTTRSLAVVTTGERILRQIEEEGAVLCRVASSHIRVGTFQYASRWGSVEELKALADYTIGRHYPGIENNENPYLALLQEVIKRQAELISKWMLVGFIHGVMNTDNMAISGETIDYGPCAFMDTYDIATVFSSIDIRGRYAYGNQPSIAQWNLARFAEALLPLLHDDEEQAVKMAQDEVSDFMRQYRKNWLGGMRGKLGIFNEEVEDESLIEDLLNMMEKYHADYTNTFRALTLYELSNSVLFGTDEFSKWNERWKARLHRQQESMESSEDLMKRSNPWVIPRNHRVEEALDAARKGEYSVMNRLLRVLSTPYDYLSNQAEYCTPSEPSDVPYQTFCGT